jgi:hypothetical protein
MHANLAKKIIGPSGLLTAGIALAMLALPMCASATLGAEGASTEADRASMGGSLRVLAGPAYAIHEIETPSGTIIREYVSPTGRVFAIAWEGPSIPDLRQALGNYFERYTAAAAGKQAGQPQVEVREPDLVVQARGHMRAFSGRAYLPELMPDRVTVEQLR